MYRWLVVLFAGCALAQTPAYEVRGSLGLTSFLDDGPENHLNLAPSARYYVSRRITVGGEFQYMRQNRGHYDLALLPVVSWDIRQGRVTPYLTGGVGLIYSSFQRFSTTEVFVQGGGGFRYYLTDRWFVAPEVRLGWEPHLQFSGAVGYTWSR